MKRILLITLVILNATAHAAGFDEAVEFVDYIFDRYAYLKVAEDATTVEIKAAVQRNKAQNHPDRTMHLSQELQDQAKWAWERTEACEAILLDEGLRAGFDERLRTFREESPALVSKSGAQIVTMGAVDLSAIEDQIDAFTGYSAVEEARAKRLFDKDPDDEDFQSIYRAALERKLAKLSVMETSAWAAAGVRDTNLIGSNVRVLDPALIAENVEKQIEHVRESVIPAQSRERARLLAIAPADRAVLLLGGAKGEPASTTDHLPAVAEAQARFDERAEQIRQRAKDKAETLEAIVRLNPFEILHRADADDLTIYLMKTATKEERFEDARVLMVLRWVDDTFAQTESPEPMTLAELRRHPHRGTSAAVLFNRELNDPFLDIGNAIKRLHESFGVFSALVINNVE